MLKSFISRGRKKQFKPPKQSVPVHTKYYLAHKIHIYTHKSFGGCEEFLFSWFIFWFASRKERIVMKACNAKLKTNTIKVAWGLVAYGLLKVPPKCLIRPLIEPPDVVLEYLLISGEVRGLNILSERHIQEQS